jgi:hypothetical protein
VIKVLVRATMSHRIFSQRTHPIHPIGPQTHVFEVFLVGVHVWTHMNIRLAHVLVDDRVSQVTDMEMSN